jgi:hypothetical protein
MTIEVEDIDRPVVVDQAARTAIGTGALGTLWVTELG